MTIISPQKIDMMDFDPIRPYQDHEVSAVLARISRSSQLAGAAKHLVLPKFLAQRFFAPWLTRLVLQHSVRDLRNIDDVQRLVSKYFEQLVDSSTDALTVSGLEHLDPTRQYLFISNHRDIVMDSSLINLLILRAGNETCRMAVGDNLLHNPLAADLMRLNKSFVVERDLASARAGYRAMTRTSQYIRHSLQEHVSVWIAQRQGRAKDGFDRTDPALLKMLLLAYRKQAAPMASLLSNGALVPVSLSYEIDPCGPAKARELAAIDRDGHYAKGEQEDLQSMIQGLVGYKGRVHVHFNEPIKGDDCDSVEELAERLDQAIVGGIRVFSINRYADSVLTGTAPETAAGSKAMSILQSQLSSGSESERLFLLQQYANICVNRRELGLDH
ncbi:MAG: 1-acyl-sn-glycerol-3-phosphate acyltransferase [Candidatus Azotimanducaceae bacterium]|jgi:1-acyl-sn-glycerol-3-phosphate acyltransferase